MGWPTSQDYNEALQNLATSFNDLDLRDGSVSTNAIGLPTPFSGNFADVYEVRSPAGQKWAVKCFTREVAGLSERYRTIDLHLKQAKLPFTVSFQFLEEGIRIHGRWYPALKMQWVEGQTINAFVRERLDRKNLLEALAQIWIRVARRLREAKLAHGDLQHGNALLVPGSTANSVGVKLIDYDGMIVPDLLAKPSGEVGHPAYQHPERARGRVYSAEVDRFPHLVIVTALRSLWVGGRQLWEKY